MKNTTLYSLLGATLVFSLTGCPGGEDETTAATTSGDPSGDPSGTTAEPDPTTTNDPDTTNGPSTSVGPDPSTSVGPDPSTTMVDPDTTNGPSTTVDPSETTGGDPGFVFPDDAFEDYVQIDRHAAVEAGTAGILASAGLGFGGEDLSVRNAYNASNPTEDAMMMWLGEIADSVMFFHAQFDDDIMALGLMEASFDDSVAQAGPVIIPDTIRWDPSESASYPNGRRLEDHVVDITLAAVLLKLGPQQPLDSFVGVLNPEENDVPFSDEFPFLAPPHL